MYFIYYIYILKVLNPTYSLTSNEVLVTLLMRCFSLLPLQFFKLIPFA